MMWGLVVALLCICRGAQPLAAQFATAISSSAHPNLFFNATEIAEIRRLLLIERTPTYAVDAYEAIRSISPRAKPPGFDALEYPDSFNTARPCTIENIAACWSYLVEPTDGKAAALRSALLSWTTTSTTTYWTTAVQHAGHIQVALAWMYDLLYPSGALSSAERTSLEAWFAACADALLPPNAYWASFTKNIVSREGSVRTGYDNWRQADFHAGVLYALISHHQVLVDRACQSSFPEDLFTSTGVAAHAPASRDWRNMINGLVFPSGYNYNGYLNWYGFNAPNEPYNGSTAGNGQSGHFYVLCVPLLSAEALCHNGFDAWRYAGEALRRTLLVGVPFAAAAGPSRDNWTPLYWLAYRRFPGDLTIRSTVFSAAARESLPYLLGRSAPLWGILGETAATPPPPNHQLLYAYPNPLSPGSGTTIVYELPNDHETHVRITDPLGTLVFSWDIPRGSYGAVRGTNSLWWHGKTRSGTAVRPGVYVCTVISGSVRLHTRLGVR